MWNAPVPPEAAVDALGETLGGFERSAVGLADAIANDGAAEVNGAGAGANATIPPNTNAATATPASRPATIDKRTFISAEGTSTSGQRRLQGAAATMPVPWLISRIGSARDSSRRS
jgi:hypothetical protein